MSKEDVTGYATVIADIPKGQLSERQQRIAAGLAMIRMDGSSIHAAAQAVQIPYSTLYDHNKGLTEPDHEKAFQAGERALVDGLLAIASLASEKVFERVEAGEMRDGDLIKAQGVSIDKIAMKRGWARGLSAADEKTQDALAGALQHLRNGKQVQITEPDPADTATVIEAETVTPDGE